MERKRLDAREGGSFRSAGAAMRRPVVTRALTAEFFREWANVGYAAMSLERVAAAAGAGKAAIYRRWPNKQSMAVDLLSEAGLSITDIEDQGSLEADLEALLMAIRRVLRHRRIRRILTDLHAEIERTPALASAIRPFQRARRARIDDLLDRAVARGEIDRSIDRATAADLIGAPLYWRMAVLGLRADSNRVRNLAFMTAAALKSGGGRSGPLDP